MKNLRFKRSTNVKTSPEICNEIIFDYTHFSYRHKTSFNDFKVISDKDNIQIFYYETKVFNFLPISPVRRFIAYKKLIPEERRFEQIYLDLASKKIFYFKCSMQNDGNNVQVINDVTFQVSNLLYFFRKPLLWIINKKFDVMWHEDKEMFEQLHDRQDHENINCVPATYNLEHIFQNSFNKKFLDDNKIDFDVVI